MSSGKLFSDDEPMVIERSTIVCGRVVARTPMLLLLLLLMTTILIISFVIEVRLRVRAVPIA